MRDARLQCRDGAAHLAGMTRHIDDRFEGFTRKRRQAVRLIAIHPDEARAGRNRPGEPTRRAGHVMAIRQGVRRNGAAEKLRAAEDQQAHWFTSGLICLSEIISTR
jgi:hypothetical protein